jgi:ribosomal protein S17
MPPMAFRGTVTKAGFMQKTVTVTVNRFMVHPVTKKASTHNFRTPPNLTDLLTAHREK